MKKLNQILERIQPLDQQTMEEARSRIDHLIKPQRSLGKLEDIAVQLSGITGKLHPKLDNKAIIVMVADHGVCEEGISAAPQSVTHLMTGYIANGVSGVCALAAQAGAQVITVDIGVAGDLADSKIIHKKIRPGTANMSKEPAMTREEAIKAIEVGIEIAEQEIKNGKNLLGTGEMGIGNTTPSTAILAVMSQTAPEEITGVGANLPKEQLDNKVAVIKRAIEINKPDKNDGIDVLYKVGGLDIAGMAGVMLAGAANRVPVVVDGYISTAAAIIATAIEPKVRDYLICSHASEEKGSAKASAFLGFEPMLNLDMRLGEGTGAALSFNIIEAAAFMNEKMITFQEAGIGVV
ncbi:MAG: nicotinate-nucleotide--dimethylbenzimidazole phosphoribosyltransferase [Clostridiaceae bacterium]|nr:nicotinate-nucleotide--dimethylbenzimidazole phosphoribosyltransferase [Clostridiaceae bacterium]